MCVGRRAKECRNRLKRNSLNQTHGKGIEARERRLVAWSLLKLDKHDGE